MLTRRKRTTRWAMPRISLPRPAREIAGALALSIAAVASRMQSARVVVAFNPSRIAVSITVEATLWQTLDSRNVPGAPRTLETNCGSVAIGPFLAPGIAVTFYTPRVQTSAGTLGCIDIRFGLAPGGVVP